MLRMLNNLNVYLLIPVMPPPPPPAPKAPTMSAPAFTRSESIKKNVPQPTNPLKSFNWSKLPDAKVQGTIWSELDDTKLYTNIELENIDKLFCAYQKNGVPVSVEHEFFLCDLSV